ncbi:MAG: prolipoprotein diacylglyceryl transferase [Deltaproteobacteria bacterium]|nr:prolipoprotein diacylglyceryl transferase [Deltaproteobacteria bacterium]MBN2673771.1 prolipoprotein diacylglyceryl transferase [Deltaproteobacteria bacterium]
MNCILWQPDAVAFHLGPVPFTWYGVMVGLFFFAAYFTLDWQFKRGGINPDKAFNFLVAIFVGGIVGAFIFHRVFYEWNTLMRDPMHLFSVKQGLSGLSSHGVLAGNFVAGLIYAKRHHIRLLELADRCAFGGALSAVFIRTGNLLNSEVIGAPTDIPWAFCFTKIDTVPRHPSQIYEAFIGILIFVVLLFADKKMGKENRPLGFMIGLCITLFFSLRFIVEFFKERQAVSENVVLSMGQFLSIPFALAGVALIIYSLKTRAPTSMPHSTGAES